jgi:hypothetical protein
MPYRSRTFPISTSSTQGNSHALQKKSPSDIRTAKRDVDLIAERLKTAERDREERHGKQKR